MSFLIKLGEKGSWSFLKPSLLIENCDFMLNIYCVWPVNDKNTLDLKTT